jgi:uncharacterized protein HemX
MNDNDQNNNPSNNNSGSNPTEPQADLMSDVHVEPQSSTPMANPALSTQPTSFQTKTKLNETHARNNKKLAAIVTIIIALIAAAAAVYVYLSAENNASESTTTQQSNKSNSESTAVTPANSQEVDSTLNDIDETLGAVDETVDFDSSDLSDEALQL